MKRVYYMFGLLALFGIVFGAAASLGVNGGVIQAGSDTELRCDTDGVKVEGWGLETDTGLVSNVRIWNINPSCSGADIFVNITNAGTKIAGSSATTIPPDQDASDNQGLVVGQVGVRIYFSPDVLASDITDITVFIEGPSP